MNRPRYAVSPAALTQHNARLPVSGRRGEPWLRPLSSPVLNPVWFVLFCRPRAEDRVAEGLDQLGYRVFLPKETVWVRVPDHKRVKGQPTKRRQERPLFARYVFVGLEPDRHSILPARSVEGVSDVVAVRGEPLRVPAATIGRMQAAAAAKDHDQTAREAETLARLLGQEFTIPDGPFQGFLATVMRIGKRDVELEVEHAGGSGGSGPTGPTGRRLRLKMGLDAVREAQA